MQIRFGSASDAEAIAGIRIESWRAAYAGLIPAAILDRELGGYDAGRVRRAFASRPWQRVLIAEQPPGPLPPPATPAPVPAPASTAQATVVGYAAFGPEQGLDGRPRTARGGPRPAQSLTAELYALYVAPAYWSTGAGRALIGRVLEQNARARRFYERAGFRLRGRNPAHSLGWLGGIPEVCYTRELIHR